MKNIILGLLSLILFMDVEAQKDIVIDKIDEVRIDSLPKGKRKGTGNGKVVTIMLNGDRAKDEKVTVEIDGTKIKVNGKDLADLKDIDVNISENRVVINGQGFSFNSNPKMNFKGVRGQVPRVISRFRSDMDGESKPMMGIVMEKTDEGVKINEITEGSGAEKAGLKKDDVITKLDSKDIKAELDVSSYINSKKVGDEVEVHYLRDGKKKKATVKLSERKLEEMKIFGNAEGLDFTELEGFKNMPNMDFNFNGEMPNFPGENWSWAQGFSTPKIGLSLIETEDDKGLEVKKVEEGSVAAKAGLQKGDLITKVNGEKVSNVADVKAKLKDLKTKPSSITYTRNGKEQTVEVKVPKKLKEVDL